MSASTADKQKPVPSPAAATAAVTTGQKAAVQAAVIARPVTDTPTVHEGRCDVCERRDGKFGHNMQRCRTCNVLVHEACYGLVQTTKKRPDWQCKACELQHEQPEGKRPTKCVLCSVSDGIHAMHPIYNKEGPDGKQLQRPSGPAWAHTLCCMFIGSFRRTEGCVFACNKAGEYDGEELDEDEEDDESGEGRGKISKPSKNGHQSNNRTGTDEDAMTSTEAHHFVICSKSVPGHAELYSVIKEHRELRCLECKQKDNVARVLRIPIQCCAGDADEMFKVCHKSSECAKAMHVGCARWKKHDKDGEKPGRYRVIFWPGALSADVGIDRSIDKPAADIYCAQHAKDIENLRKKETTSAVAATGKKPAFDAKKDGKQTEVKGMIAPSKNEKPTPKPAQPASKATSTFKRKELQEQKPAGKTQDSIRNEKEKMGVPLKRKNFAAGGDDKVEMKAKVTKRASASDIGKERKMI